MLPPWWPYNPWLPAHDGGHCLRRLPGPAGEHVSSPPRLCELRRKRVEVYGQARWAAQVRYLTSAGIRPPRAGSWERRDKHFIGGALTIPQEDEGLYCDNPECMELRALLLLPGARWVHGTGTTPATQLEYRRLSWKARAEAQRGARLRVASTYAAHELLRNHLTRNNAARLLGVSREVIDTMLDENLLRADDQRDGGVYLSTAASGAETACVRVLADDVDALLGWLGRLLRDRGHEVWDWTEGEPVLRPARLRRFLAALRAQAVADAITTTLGATSVL